MQSYNAGLGAYAQSAAQINSNLGAYRADVDNIKAQNKQLVQSAEQTIDLDALKGLGEELAVRGFKQMVGKYGSKLYEYKIPKLNKSVGDLDREGTEGLKKFGKRAFNKARGYDPEGDVEETGEGVEMDTFSTNSRMGGAGDSSAETMEDGGGDMVDDNMADDALVDGEDPVTSGSFEDFMNQFNTPTTDTGDIDFQRSSNQLQMGQEDMQSRSLQREGLNETRERGDMGNEDTNAHDRDADERGEEGGEDEPLEDSAEGMEGDAGDLADGARSALSDATEGASDALGGLAEGAATEGADTAVAGGLEAAGTALDATGVGAIVGIPLQVAGAVLEGGALYEAGKSVVDWFEQSILGEKPPVPTMKIPKMPPSIAQRGLLLTPNLDTIDTQTGYGGSF